MGAAEGEVLGGESQVAGLPDCVAGQKCYFAGADAAFPDVALPAIAAVSE